MTLDSYLLAESRLQTAEVLADVGARRAAGAAAVAVWFRLSDADRQAVLARNAARFQAPIPVHSEDDDS